MYDFWGTISDKFRGLCRNVGNAFRNSYNAVKNFCVGSFNGVINFFENSTNFCVNTFRDVKDACTNRAYYNTLLISLGAVAGAGIALTFGLGIFSAASKIFLPKILTKIGVGICIGVPTAGVVSGMAMSEYLYSLGRTDGQDNNRSRRLCKASLISLSSLAASGVTVVLGLGILSATNVLFPSLSTMVSTFTLAAAPVVSGFASICVVNHLDSVQDESSTINVRSNGNSHYRLAAHSCHRTRNFGQTRSQNFNIPREYSSSSRSRSI